MRRGVLLAFILAACGGGGGDDDTGVTTEHCSYTPVPATAGAGGTVQSGTLQAGAAERAIDMPVGSALAAYTARAGFLGEAGNVDSRKIELSGNFNPSIGIESAPMVKALALSAGGETLIILKLDLGYPYEGMVYDLEDRLGEAYRGKIYITASHSHSAWGHFSAHSAYQLGSGVFRETNYQRFLDIMEQTARDALDLRRDAKLGVVVDNNFDPEDQITRDRRGEDNDMPRGQAKDDRLFMFRIDSTTDEPIAAMYVYGMHGTLNGEDNSLASTDAIGATERMLAENLSGSPVVMHLQGAGGNVSPAGHGGIDCNIHPGAEDDPCFGWLSAEGNARAAMPVLRAAWQAAGADMVTELELEGLTRSIEQGPNPETFTVRDGELSYAPWDGIREPDRLIFGTGGEVLSPIDEFNAPVGAGLCENDETIYFVGLMPGVDELSPYASCAKVDPMTEVFEILLDTDFESDERHPICQSTRTTISAFRIGDYVFGTLPGEPTVHIADYIREQSPFDADHTVVLGYAQGEVGYILRPEDWLLGGYEASINLWGPLEGEHLAEQLIALLPLATSAEREDGSLGGTDRCVPPEVDDGLEIDDPAPMAGTVPATVPDDVWLRTGPAVGAQPPASIPRVAGHATFVWIGDDPLVANPDIWLERETAPDTWTAVLRRSGRAVEDGEILIAYTPQPLRRVAGEAQTHYWTAEWQAVPWIGCQEGPTACDGLDAFAGVPLGNYRFHVVGDDFSITSDPFEVVQAPLFVTASRASNDIAIAVAVAAPKGYRFLDANVPSNTPVPIRAGTFDVTMTQNGGPDLSFPDQVIGSDGVLHVDAGADAADVLTVTITDTWGNTQTDTL